MLTREVLRLDPSQTCERIAECIKEQVLGSLRRRGVLVGLSGGVDSSVVAALCVRALGADRVFALFMPERDSSPDSLRLGRLVAETLGVTAELEDIAPGLDGLGCYRRQCEAIREVFPDYQLGQKFKISLPSLLEGNRLNVFRLTVETASGQLVSSRMPVGAYLKLVAATNFKQRTRKMLEYYHADRLGYAVAGTPNRLEYDQGFFVKQGDGAADFKPIAHLYKTQVYQLSEYLGIPEEIRARLPTTDTYSLAQTQEEFYFALPYAEMDLCLYARDHDIAPDLVAPVVGLTAEQVEVVYRDIESKRRAARYLHQSPLFVQEIH